MTNRAVVELNWRVANLGLFYYPFSKKSLFTAAFFIANSPLSFKLEGGKRMVTSNPVKEPLSAILLIFVSNNFQKL